MSMLQFVPDLRTILVMTIFVFAIQGYFLYKLYNIKRRPAFALLALGCATFALGFVGYFLRPYVGMNLITGVAANLMILAYPVFLLATLMQCHGIDRPIRALWWGAPGLVLLAVVAWVYLDNNLLVVVVASAINGFYYLFIAVYVARNLPLAEPGMRLTLVSNVLLAAVLFGRAGVAWVMLNDLASAQAQPTVALWLSYTLMIALFCLSAQIYGLPLQEFTRSERSLRHLASVDPLTEVLNRRSFFEQAQAVSGPVSVLMLDLDRFKAINDRFGHATGDRVIVTFARLLRDALRRDDVLGRMGGEEFAIILPGVDQSRALEVAERIRAACEAETVTAENGFAVRLTVSIGVAEGDGAHLDALLKQADMAMYQAKEKGRNRVVWAGQAA
ncbi:MAG: GGDEF domain-containing protein [Magnetospirillum sp.]|nr:GGDEF domain-containing protein [Magnetospirillum sp.]